MFSTLCCPLFSQEYDEENTADASVFVISEINYTIKGWTKPFAIAYNVELRKGVEFQSLGDLDAYVARKTQDLRNQRVFKEDSCFIEYSLGNPGDDGKIPVTLDVRAEDSWNIIVLPEPKYDSNSGFSLTLKARDYNFLGTMSPVRLDLGYELDNDGENTYGFLLDSDIPFRAFGLTWTVNFDNELKYTVGEPLYYKNVTGLSVYLPWKTTAFTFGFNQYLYVNEENSDEEKTSPGGTAFFEDIWYMASELYGQWRIPTGLEVLSFGSLDYTPRITETIRYRPGGDVGEWRHPILSLSHSIGFGRVDWLGNYRQGLDVRLSNGNDFDQVNQTWNNNFAATAVAHYRFGKLFGVSGRLRFHVWRDPYTGAGDMLRGIYNDDLTARKMLSLNLEFPFRLIRFVPSEWFRHKYWRILDFEQHWSPFIDIALADDPNKVYGEDGARFASSDIIATAGLEVITFPLSWRSIYLRISVGCDLRGDIWEWPKKHNKVFLPAGSEIYIGLGHFF
jgi:hypothetical protein